MKKTSFQVLTKVLWQASLAGGLALGACGGEMTAGELDADPASTSSALAARTLDTAAKTTATKGTTSPETAKTATLVTSPVVTATLAPVASANSDRQSSYPWVVNVSASLGCHGVLVHPSWVLTAAHCIGTTPGKVSFTRTDPATGAVITDSRNFDINGPKRGMFVHPEFVADSGFGQPKNDIALVKLATPFALGRHLQTVALPRAAAVAGRTGTIVTNPHTTQAAGYTAVVRAPQLASCASPSNFFCVNPPAGSLCKGDSGSGFTEILDGRATVVGVASNISGSSDCVGENGQLQLADVFAFRDWIHTTMNMSPEQVAGRVRLRASGSSLAGTTSGSLAVRCTNTGGTQVEAGINVPGGEIAVDCDDVAVACIAPSGRTVTSFQLRTFAGNGGLVGTQSLPFVPAFTAVYANPGASFLQYTCGVSGDPSDVAVINTGGVLARF